MNLYLKPITSSDFLLVLEPIKYKVILALEWEVRKQIRRYTYKLQTIRKGQIFGYEEISNEKSIRCCRAVADGDVKLIFIDKIYL